MLVPDDERWSTGVRRIPFRNGKSDLARPAPSKKVSLASRIRAVILSLAVIATACLPFVPFASASLILHGEGPEWLPGFHNDMVAPALARLDPCGTYMRVYNGHVRNLCANEPEYCKRVAPPTACGSDN